MVGILKAGGAYLPLDATMPNDRLRFVLTDASMQTAMKGVYAVGAVRADKGVHCLPLGQRREPWMWSLELFSRPAKVPLK